MSLLSNGYDLTVPSAHDDENFPSQSYATESSIWRGSSQKVIWSFCVVGMAFLLLGSGFSEFGFDFTKSIDNGNNSQPNNDFLGKNYSVVAGSSDAYQTLEQRLAPKEITALPNMTLSERQFLHLHHMKTAGTSLDTLLQCAIRRLSYQGYFIPYYNIHECSPSFYQACLSGTDQRCQKNIKSAAFVSYCAPIKDLPVFGWNKEPDQFDAVTILRHPVNRVWSMYRFKTKQGYGCRTLRDIYNDIDTGTSDLELVFQDQLLNHQTRNLLPPGAQGTDDELVDMATYSIQNFFSMVGITEDMATTSQMISRVFPWMAPQIPGSDQVCEMPHKNASPQNNYCGPNSTHWDLPDHPDEETARLIEQHNQLDMRVYEAALAHFARQKQALGLH